MSPLSAPRSRGLPAPVALERCPRCQAMATRSQPAIDGTATIMATIMASTMASTGRPWRAEGRFLAALARRAREEWLHGVSSDTTLQPFDAMGPPETTKAQAGQPRPRRRSNDRRHHDIRRGAKGLPRPARLGAVSEGRAASRPLLSRHRLEPWQPPRRRSAFSRRTGSEGFLEANRLLPGTARTEKTTAAATTNGGQVSLNSSTVLPGRRRGHSFGRRPGSRSA
jgi:hypothetical protein